MCYEESTAGTVKGVSRCAKVWREMRKERRGGERMKGEEGEKGIGWECTSRRRKRRTASRSLKAAFGRGLCATPTMHCRATRRATPGPSLYRRSPLGQCQCRYRNCPTAAARCGLPQVLATCLLADQPGPRGRIGRRMGKPRLNVMRRVTERIGHVRGSMYIR